MDTEQQELLFNQERQQKQNSKQVKQFLSLT